MKLLVIDRERMTVRRAVTYAEADSFLGEDALGAEAIEWTIEEHGRCDTMSCTIIPEEWEDTK